MATKPPAPSGTDLRISAARAHTPRGKGEAGRHRKHKRCRRTRKSRWPAHLPPPGPGEPPETRYYESPKRALAAQRLAWARFRGRERAAKAVRALLARPGQTDEKFNDRRHAVNPTEAKFLLWLQKQSPDANVQRAGWPDFLIDDRGSIRCVEVKSPGDPLSPDQTRCMMILERAGIPCLVWCRDELVKFRDYVVKGWPGDAPRCSSGQESPQKLRETPQHATLASDDQNPGVLH